MRRLANTAMNLATVVVTLGALGSVAWRVLEYARRPSDPSARREVDDWPRFGQDGQSIGAVHPKVTIVEFADYECPFCAQAAPILDSLLSARSSDLRVVYRHLPLEIHPHSRTAAVAAECAALQGKFHAVHVIMYERQADLGRLPWVELGAAASIPDVNGFSECVEKPGDRITARLESDRLAATDLGLDGTPAFLINQLLVPGYQGRDTLAALVSRALREVGK